MSEQLRLRGDTAANVAAYTGPSRETVVDTTNNRLVVQDGLTQGGWAAAKLAETSRVGRTAVSGSYSALAMDRLIAVTTIVSPIYITLPAAATFQPGARLIVIDESGAASFSKPITLVPAGSDVVAGLYPNAITAPYGYLELESSPNGQWTMTDGASSGSIVNTLVSNATITNPTAGSSAFGGQAIVGLTQPVAALTIADARIKATTRLAVSAHNPLALAKGLIVSINLTGAGAGKFDALATVATLDGKIAPSQMARLLLTLNYIGV